MGNTSLDKRGRSSLAAFFGSQPEHNRFEDLTYAGEAAGKAVGLANSREGADKWIWAARSLFLFLPGSFCLFYITLIVAYYYPEMESFDVLTVFWFLATGFITYAGAGSLNRVQNLIVPGVVVAAALGIVINSPLFPGSLEDLYFGYSIYAFPFVLVSAKLAQAWTAAK